MWNRNEQTICAISTPHGVGGIAVIRISGKEALSICKKISKKLSKKSTVESHKAYFSDILDLEKNKVDETLITYFAEGKSFTGEEVVEISCHGSRFITQQILDLLIKCGCRIADKGEFTYRAFMNGKLDLVQAESVLSLIESQNLASAKVALRQLEGHISKEFEILISDLTWCLAHIEASIDFIEQGVEVVDQKVLISKLKGINQSLEKLIKSYQSGRLIKDGIKVALIGEPNVGKSSLLNMLLQNEKAIVTPIAGTTRDVIDGEIVFEGVKFNISDTAGLRETQDQVEIIGIDKSKKEAENADVLCFVLDCSQTDWERSLQLATQLKNTKKIFLLNKSDIITKAEKNELLTKLGAMFDKVGTHKALPTTTISGASREDIFKLVIESVGSIEYLNEAIISSSRQFEQAQDSFSAIERSLVELENNMGAEFVAMYLKEALVSLQKILGQVYDDQIMDRIFKEFCLGK
ncbi:MAG: tRNA uridine-5-carboxymethylaminomethyl(34) synthesis GTPase MnmE [Pseudobdellovibrio sp.]